MQTKRREGERSLQVLNMALTASLHSAVVRERTLSDAAASVARELGSFKRSHSLRRIGMVSGILGSDGQKALRFNMGKLNSYTHILRRECDFPLFSAADIYCREFMDRFGRVGDRSEWDRFWRTVLEGGGVTDMFMAPRWRLSGGARLQREVAMEAGMEVHNVERHRLLLRSLFGRRSDKH